MSEELSNTAEATATGGAETTAEPTQLATETSNQDDNGIKGAVEKNEPSSKPNHTKRKVNLFGRDKAADALKQAEFEKMQKPETISLENLEDVNLPEGKGIDFRSVVDALPDDAKTLIGNLRADYTRKTQELANQRKELEAQMKSLTESEFFAKVQERANQPDVQLDPYDTESFNQRIEQEVARRLNQMYEPVRQQQELQMRQLKLQEFKNQHPDLEDMKSDVADLLKSNQSLSLQDAYFIAKGKKTSEELSRLRDENAERKARMREVGLKISTGKNVNPNRPPKGLKGFELYQWFERQKAKK